MLQALEQYSADGCRVSMQEFEAFLVDQQHELEIHAASIITNFVQDPQRNVQEPYFHMEEVSSCFWFHLVYICLLITCLYFLEEDLSLSFT